MKGNKVFNVFIASPGDVVVERKIVHEVCLGINKGILPNPLGISFQIKEWEDLFPSSGRSQEIIKRLVDECDIFVCILYKRFDSLSGREKSATLEEFLLAYDSWKSLKQPHLMFYFKEVKISPKKDLKDPQLNKVLKLKEKIKSEKLLFFDKFSAPYEFCEKIHDYLEKWASENVKKGGEAAIPTSSK